MKLRQEQNNREQKSILLIILYTVYRNISIKVNPWPIILPDKYVNYFSYGFL